MKKEIKYKECKKETLDLSLNELQQFNGGSFAYDFGFFLREMWIAKNLVGGIGVIEASVDFCIYYKPVY